MTADRLKLAPASGAKKSNLAFALAGLPADRRRDALVFYAFCREVDDIADEPGPSVAEKQSRLDAWKAALDSGDGLPPELERVLTKHAIDRGLLGEIVQGMEMDLGPKRYETYDELRGYCWRVACAVGLTSIRIFGCQSPDSRVYAEHLGYALQLTNILRDVAEDAALGRIYLPAEDLRRFGVSEESLLRGHPDPGFPELMRFEAARARALLAEAAAALPPADREALRPAELMRAIYQRILERMARDGFRVFATRYRIPTAEKIGILLYARFFPGSFATSNRVGMT